MSDEQKPVAETPVEPTPAADKPAEAPVAEASEPAAETKPEAPTSETPAANPDPAPAEKEKVGDDKVKVAAEPITQGALGYKAPGLLKSFKFSSKYFWLGDEPVTTQNLSQYLRGEKPDVAHPTAAWASQTGKGLLFFAKHADSKATPTGVIKLADAGDVVSEGTVHFSFKLHGQKHQFETKTEAERDGWLVAVKKAVEEAKAAAEELVGSQGYKDTVSQLGKPAALAAGSTTAKAEGSTPKKSTELKPAEDVKKDTATDDSDEGKKSKGKSRSVSRGKRASIFGALRGKKEESAEKKEEDKAEDKKDEPEAAVAAAETPAVAEPATTETTAEEAKPAEATPAADATAEAKDTKATTPKADKAGKRSSIFGDLFQKVKSPATEKKESEVAPVVPPKDTEAPQIEAPATETAAAPAEEAPKTETAPAPAAATSPTKEKEGFFGKFKKSVDKVRSPSSEIPKDKAPEKISDEAPKIEAPGTETAAESEAAPAAEAPAATTEAPAVPEKDAAPVNGAPEGKEKRRTSFFGTIKKKPAEGETSEGEPEKKGGIGKQLGGIFRNPSKAVRGNKESKKETSTPAKVEEKDETAPEASKATEPTTNGTTEEGKPAEQSQSIGDVVPDAVHVGQQESTPAVSAAA